MRPFEFVRAESLPQIAQDVQRPKCKVIAGGTLLVDLLRLDVEQPERVIDVSRLPWQVIEDDEHALQIGSLVTNTDLAYHPQVLTHFALLSEAILAGASPQIRNRATLGGNLLQRTRCAYFRDVGEPACNKRNPGSGCAALEGYSRMHAILGGSSHCIATHPSDMCVALAALDCDVMLVGPSGERKIAFADFHLLPKDQPQREHGLAPGELVSGVRLAKPATRRRSAYVKVRDRASFAFAIASAAVSFELRDDQLSHVRVALGGVATVPWRATSVERHLEGKPWSLALAEEAAARAIVDAKFTKHNQFKLQLIQNAIVRALERALEVV